MQALLLYLSPSLSYKYRLHNLPYVHLTSNQGNVEFDPLGFSDTTDVKFLREAELKHGAL